MTKIRFICGCVDDVDLADIGWWRDVGTDREGFLICVRHGQRRFGWRSLPEIHTSRGNFADFDFACYSPLEIEQFLIFGKPLPAISLRPETVVRPTQPVPPPTPPPPVKVVLDHENGDAPL